MYWNVIRILPLNGKSSSELSSTIFLARAKHSLQDCMLSSRWSEPSLSARRRFRSFATRKVSWEDSSKTARMRRLTWYFARHTCSLVGTAVPLLNHVICATIVVYTVCHTDLVNGAGVMCALCSLNILPNHLILSTPSFWCGRFHLWIWVYSLLQICTSVKPLSVKHTNDIKTNCKQCRSWWDGS